MAILRFYPREGLGGHCRGLGLHINQVGIKEKSWVALLLYRFISVLLSTTFDLKSISHRRTHATQRPRAQDVVDRHKGMYYCHIKKY